jgi:hypothetical protein
MNKTIKASLFLLASCTALSMNAQTANTDVLPDAALKKLREVGLSIEHIEPSPVKDIYTVISREGVSYVSKDGDYIFTGSLFHVNGKDVELVFTLFDNEGGKVGTFSRNKNGTYDIGPMQINSSNLPEIRDHFPSVTWRVLAYDACASFWVGTWWLYRKIVDRKGNVFEGIADYNSKTPKVRATYIFNFMIKYNRRIQRRNGMDELYQWTQPKPQYNGHIVKNLPE